VKISLYEYQLDKDALLILDENYNIIEANNEAVECFSLDQLNNSDEFLEKLEEILAINNLSLYLELAFKDHLELGVDTSINKKVFFKSEMVNEEKRVNIVVTNEMNKNLDSIMESYFTNKSDSLIYFDQLENELKVTKGFFELFDIDYNDHLTSRMFLLKVLRKLENKGRLFNLISNKFNKYDEFLGVLLQTTGQKIEYVYKKYEFEEDIKGILFNFTAIDREIPKVVHDQTTELIEKKVLLEEMEFLIKNSENSDKKLAFFVVNINNFKNINDLYGLKMGDYVLRQVAKRLKKIVRLQDIVGRYSADEFIILINDYEKEEVLEKIATRILKKISMPIKIVNRSVYVNGCIGISLSNRDETFKNLLKKGMSALSYAKKSENKISYYNEYLDKIVKEKLELEHELKEAIKNKDFVIHYQPQISYITKDISGVEALVRWNHKEKGLISPGVFIKLAEDLDLIKDIEAIVLEKTIKETKEIRKKYNLNIAVNLSNKQFIDEIFIEKIESFNENMDFLEIEITESTAIIDLDRSLEMINRYKKLGISIAIDDFGVGYSSLSHLKILPLDKIKIDKSFINNIVNNKGDQTLVQAVLLIAETLKLEVIAEGVENEEQLNKLIELGCNIYQGFYFEKPCNIIDLEKNLYRNRYKIRG
jgi:diguanylate cyclase (GGDEF)-like protein